MCTGTDVSFRILWVPAPPPSAKLTRSNSINQFDPTIPILEAHTFKESPCLLDLPLSDVMSPRSMAWEGHDCLFPRSYAQLHRKNIIPLTETCSVFCYWDHPLRLLPHLRLRPRMSCANSRGRGCKWQCVCVSIIFSWGHSPNDFQLSIQH